uniref:B30.2/SPRY domain-containing protein n=1 Tax=Globodera rostochiensis TaxID=31243 RepID=A0A914GXR7_GLORO
MDFGAASGLSVNMLEDLNFLISYTGGEGFQTFRGPALVPIANNVFYYEVKIEECGADAIAIGFGPTDFELDKCVGRQLGTHAYASDGKFLGGPSVDGVIKGKKQFGAGHTIGAGVDLRCTPEKIIYTWNGLLKSGNNLYSTASGRLHSCITLANGQDKSFVSSPPVPKRRNFHLLRKNSLWSNMASNIVGQRRNGGAAAGGGETPEGVPQKSDTLSIAAAAPPAVIVVANGQIEVNTKTLIAAAAVNGVNGGEKVVMNGRATEAAERSPSTIFSDTVPNSPAKKCGPMLGQMASACAIVAALHSLPAPRRRFTAKCPKKKKQKRTTQNIPFPSPPQQQPTLHQIMQFLHKMHSSPHNFKSTIYVFIPPILGQPQRHLTRRER